MLKEEKRFVQNNIFEGIVSLRALIDIAKTNNGNDRRIVKVFYDNKKISSERNEYLWLCHRADELNFVIQFTERSEIDEITVGNSHGGIAVLCSERTITDFSEETDISGSGFYIMIDGIEDPYNFGYAIRSLYAAGADGIILRERNWMSSAGVVCRASAGASEMIPIFLSRNIENTVNIFKKKKYRIVCADMRDSVSIYDSDLKKPLFLIIGGEKRGISRSVLKLSDQNVKIDYAREFNASLSAASAATIVGFEVFRQNL